MELADFDVLETYGDSTAGNLAAPPLYRCWKVESSEDAVRMARWAADLQRQQFQRIPNSRFVMVVDESPSGESGGRREIVAVARWDFCPNGYHHETMGWLESDPWRNSAGDPPSAITSQPGLNYELFQAIWEAIVTARKGWMVDGPLWGESYFATLGVPQEPRDHIADIESAVLAVLITREGYRKRGAGGMLVDWGLKQAERDNVPAYVEASAMGLPVYLRCGFKTDGEPLNIDLSRLGLEQPMRPTRLSRYPESAVKE